MDFGVETQLTRQQVPDAYGFFSSRYCFYDTEFLCSPVLHISLLNCVYKEKNIKKGQISDTTVTEII